MIPKIFHRIWLGNSEIPQAYEGFWKNWKRLHPEWEFKDWRDSDITVLSLYKKIKGVESNAAKSDIARYEIVYLYGGIYLDCDMDCYQPIDDLIAEQDDFIVCNQNDEFKALCSIGFFASTPKHFILTSALQALAETSIHSINSNNVAEITGPYFFRRVINNRKVKMLDTYTFYPYFHLKSEWYERDASQIYGIHTWGGSWLPIDMLLHLATKQHRYRDFKSCLETCDKAFDKIKINSAAVEYSYLREFERLSVSCKAQMALRSLFVTPLVAIIAFFMYGLYASVLNTRQSDFLKKVVRKIYRLCWKLLEKVFNTFSVKLVALQYNHLLDSLFSYRCDSQVLNVIEIGAMDGKSFDSLYPYLKTHSNIKALFVEPLGDMIEELKENYKGYEKEGNDFLFEEVAVTDIEESVAIYTIPRELRDSKNLPDWTKGISTLCPEKNALREAMSSDPLAQSLGSLAIKRAVKGEPLEKILNRCAIKEVDILQIDTEGYDFHVLSQSLELVRPRVICFEWANLDEEEKDKSINKLISMGYLLLLSTDSYDCIACTYDTWAKNFATTFRNHSVQLFPPIV